MVAFTIAIAVRNGGTSTRVHRARTTAHPTLVHDRRTSALSGTIQGQAGAVLRVGQSVVVASRRVGATLHHINARTVVVFRAFIIVERIDIGATTHVVARIVVSHALDHEGHHLCRGSEGMILDLGLKRHTDFTICGQLGHQDPQVVACLDASQISGHPAPAHRRVPDEVRPRFKRRENRIVAFHRDGVLVQREERIHGLTFRLEE